MAYGACTTAAMHTRNVCNIHTAKMRSVGLCMHRVVRKSEDTFDGSVFTIFKTLKPIHVISVSVLGKIAKMLFVYLLPRQDEGCAIRSVLSVILSVLLQK